MTPIPKAKKKPTKRRQNMTKELDRLFSLVVRSVGRCEADDGRACNGPLQCAHGFTRSYRAIRWDRRNAFALCAGHHMFYTHNPIAWDDWLLERMGTVNYLRVRALANGGFKPDTAALLEQLRAEVKELAA